MKELNFAFFLSIFKKHWWKIVTFTLVVMIIAAAITHFLIPKKYSSSVNFYVVNVNTDLDYTQAAYLSAAEYLINDYVEIIKGDTLLGHVSDLLAEDGYEDITPDKLRKMITNTSKSDTSVFTISVTHTDKKLAYRTAQILAEIAPSEVTDIAKPADATGKRAAANVLTVLKSMQKSGDFDLEAIPSELEILQHLNDQGMATERLDCIAVLKSPVEAKTHDSPNVVTNTILCGMIAAVIAYAFFLLFSILAATIVTEEDVKTMLKYPVLGAIPHWEAKR